MPIVLDKVEMDKVANRQGEYAVKAYNNEITPFDSVMMVFIVTCGYSEQLAKEYTLAIHKNGFSRCFEGSRDACNEVISDFRKIGVKAELIEPNAE